MEETQHHPKNRLRTLPGCGTGDGHTRAGRLGTEEELVSGGDLGS